jgi:hypothetical protein
MLFVMLAKNAVTMEQLCGGLWMRPVRSRAAVSVPAGSVRLRGSTQCAVTGLLSVWGKDGSPWAGGA